MSRFVMVLKAGPEYRTEHAIWLAKQIDRYHPGAEIVCLSDIRFKHPLINIIPLKYCWKGWWSKMELYNPDKLTGSVCYMDIDTVITGPVEDLFNLKRSTALADFYRLELVQSGVLFLTEQMRAKIWEAFIRDPSANMARGNTRRFWGDGGFLMHFMNELDRWQTVRPGQVVSYKVHCRPNNGRIPTKARLVCFHGNPRPWNSNAKWVPKL